MLKRVAQSEAKGLLIVALILTYRGYSEFYSLT